jgi:hypothetical protein
MYWTYVKKVRIFLLRGLLGDARLRPFSLLILTTRTR